MNLSLDTEKDVDLVELEKAINSFENTYTVLSNPIESANIQEMCQLWDFSLGSIDPILTERADLESLDMVQNYFIHRNALNTTLQLAEQLDNQLDDRLNSAIVQEFGRFGCELGINPGTLKKELDTSTITKIKIHLQDSSEYVKELKSKMRIQSRVIFDYLKSSDKDELQLTINDFKKTGMIELANQYSAMALSEISEKVGSKVESAEEIDVTIGLEINPSVAASHQIHDNDEIILFKAKVGQEPVAWDFNKVPQERLPDYPEEKIFNFNKELVKSDTRTGTYLYELAKGITVPVKVSVFFIWSRIKRDGYWETVKPTRSSVS